MINGIIGCRNLGINLWIGFLNWVRGLRYGSLIWFLWVWFDSCRLICYFCNILVVLGLWDKIIWGIVLFIDFMIGNGWKLVD